MSLSPAYSNPSVAMRPVTKVRILGVRLGIVILAIYWLGIFTGTHLPSVPTVLPDFNDKAKHFTAFFGLGLLLCYVTSGGSAWRRFGTVLAMGAAYAVVDEWSQGLVPGRTSDFLDWIADISGIVSAIGLYLLARSLSTATKRSGCYTTGRLLR